jgi:hypothetical protein
MTPQFFMRRRSLLALIIIVVAALGLFFMNTRSSPAFAIGIAGVKNRQPVGLVIQILVTNRAARPLGFEASALTLSDGMWCDDYRDGREGSVEAEDFTDFVVQTHETPTVVQVRIEYWKLKTRRERWLEDLRRSIGMRPARIPWEREAFVSEPFTLPRH